MHLQNFNYSILGSNSENRVVFLHGLMAFSANWRKIASRVSDQFQCLIYDQRGHGRSFKPDHGYGLEVLAQDLFNIVSELGWTKFHLVGHSMGGRVAMVFAHLYPEMVKTLTIEDVGPDKFPESYKYYENMLNCVPTPFNSKDSVKKFFAEVFLTKFTPSESADVLVLFLQANIEEKTEGVYDWRFFKQAMIDMIREGNQKDRWLEVSSFKMPVLLIRGEHSNHLLPEAFEKMLAVNPNIDGVVIESAGHWVHYEKYAEFTDILRQFLNKH